MHFSALCDPSNIDKQKAHWRDLPMGLLFVAMWSASNIISITLYEIGFYEKGKIWTRCNNRALGKSANGDNFGIKDNISL